MRPLVKTILTTLENDNVKKKKGQISCTLAGVSFYVDNRDILGGIIQQWFGEWLNVQKIKWTPPKNSQTWPDFILANGNHLEVKCFNYDESPGFDVANFGAYINSLLIHPERLDDDYIVFGYKFDGVNLWIEDYWVKNIWELTGPSDSHYLNLQVKRNQVNNIRPKNWRNPSVKMFGNRKQFVTALSLAVEKFGMGNSTKWLNSVEQAYKLKTSNNL